MRKLTKYLLILSLLAAVGCRKSTRTDGSYQAKVDSLMQLMTLQEKLGQLNLPAAGDLNTGIASNTDIAQKIRDGHVGGLFNITTAERIREVQKIAVDESRLKIPLLFGMDVIHGYKTVFPIPLGLSCTWDLEMIEKTARIAASEVSTDGICWTFSPMVDIARDPRWGRIAEGSGEDPYLCSEIAKAMVRGYQGDDLSASNTLMACVKHYAMYGAAEAGRDYNTTDMSRLRMYNEYLPPYKAAVDAGVGSVMASFNEVDGIPATGNHWLMTEVLRNQWGFKGFVVTDYTGIKEMTDHGMGDLQTVTALALKAGIDMDMVTEGMVTTLAKSLNEGLITEEMINQACRRILEAKFRLGLFDDPYRYIDIERRTKEVYSEENRKYARSVAAQSFVLLKNENNVLPLANKGKVAVIGPLADNSENMVGTWSVASENKKAVSILQALRNRSGEDLEFLYAKGANIYADAALEARVSIFGKPTYRDKRSPAEMIREAVAIANRSDVVLAVLGESSEMSGESSSRTDIQIPDTQQELLKALMKTGKPIVLVLLTGRPLALKWESENVPAILNVWFGGSEAGNAIADVLFGDVNPSGKLTTTFPQNIGQVPMYYSHKNTGRPLEKDKWFEKFRSNYLDVSNEPLYPFGFGLSYTTFRYGKPVLNTASLRGDETLEVSVEVSNTGTRAGTEVVQLYIQDLVGSITRPVKELKDFKKITLAAGETQTVTFEITTNDLMFYNYNLEYVWEPGEFEIMVGTNSRDVTSVNVNWVKK